MNPIVFREGLDRFRGRRGWPFLLLWILGNGVFVFLLNALANENGGGPGAVNRAVSGRIVFQGVTLLLMVGILMMIPGIAAVSIVGERERQTMRLVQVTPLTPGQIVRGKLAATLAYLGWLIAAILPLLVAPMLLGGVRIGDVFGAVAMLALLAVTVGALSVWTSARSKSSRAAVAGAYLWVALLMGATGVLALGEAFVKTQRFNQGLSGELYALIANPYIAVVAAVDYPVTLESSGDPFYLANAYLRERESRQEIIEIDGEQFLKPTRPPLWILSAASYLLLTWLGLKRAERWVQTPSPAEFKVRRTK